LPVGLIYGMANASRYSFRTSVHLSTGLTGLALLLGATSHAAGWYATAAAVNGRFGDGPRNSQRTFGQFPNLNSPHSSTGLLLQLFSLLLPLPPSCLSGRLLAVWVFLISRAEAIYGHGHPNGTLSPSLNPWPLRFCLHTNGLLLLLTPRYFRNSPSVAASAALKTSISSLCTN
jgi:hypothetical protein